MNTKRLLSTKEKCSQAMQNTTVVKDYVDSLKKTGIEYAINGKDNEIASALITNILHYLYLKNRQSVLKLYSEVFLKYDDIYDLEPCSYSVWIPISDPLCLTACSIIETQCIRNTEMLREMLQWVRDGILDAYLSEFMELNPKFVQSSANVLRKIFLTFDGQFDTVAKINEIKGVLIKNKDIKNLFVDEYEAFIKMFDCYTKVIADQNSFYQFSWLYLYDYSENARFSERVVRSIFDVLKPMQMSLSNDRRQFCYYRIYQVYSCKFESKEAKEVSDIVNRHLDKFEVLMQSAFFDRFKLNSWGEIQHLFENFNFSTMTMFPWIPDISTQYWKIFSVSADELNETFKAVIYNALNILIIGVEEYNRVRRIMLEEMPTCVENYITDSLLYYLIAAKHADTEFSKNMLKWFYSEIHSDNHALEFLQDENKSLKELNKRQQNRLNALSKQIQQSIDTPKKIGLTDEEYVTYKLQNDNENLRIEINKVRHENALQEEYISRLEEMLANTQALDNVSDDNNNTVIEDRVIVAGYISGIDQQKILQNLPNAEFLTDRSRCIPENTAIIIITNKMSHKLMYKILASTTKEYIHYYNGTNMQNLYKVLL